MAEPADLTQLDIQDLPPEKAAVLVRAQQAALAAQQHHALLGMLSASPELQKAGEMEYGQAGRERAGGRETSANVLKLALEKTSQERQLAALQQQIEYQRGQLGLQSQQLGLEGQRLGASILGPLVPALLGAQTQEQTIKGFSNLLGEHWGKKLGEVLATKPEAERKSIMDYFQSVGLPLQGLLPTPKVPGPKGTKAPKAAAPPSHYLVSPDGKMRIAATADGKPLPGAQPEPIP